MLVLNWIALAMWLGAMAYMASGAWGAVWGHSARRGDPMRLACFVTAGIFAGYISRGLFWPGDPTSGVALRLMSMADAIYIVLLGRAYGRGDHV